MCDLRTISTRTVLSIRSAGKDVPLIRFWSEAGCPTCAEFVYSGFAEDEQGAARFLSALENWNRPRSGLVSP